MQSSGEGSDQSSAEVALRAALDDIFSGGGMAILQDFTSAAYVDLLHLLPHFSDLPTPEGYEIGGCEAVEGAYRFQVRLQVPDRDLDIFMLMTGGQNKPWKVAAITVPGIEDQ